MICRHLRALEKAILARGIKETYRGQAWSKACREWVYFDCYLDRPAIRAKFPLAVCVVDHEHLGTHDGAEEGFYCKTHEDGIMGVHRSHRSQAGVGLYRGET